MSFFSCKLGSAFLLLFLPFAGNAQPSADMAALVSKHPGQPGVILERSMNVSVVVDKAGNLSFSVDQHDVIAVLTENIAPFTSGKEYFGYGHSLKRMVAYTLAPEPKGYRKVVVRDFTKTTEIGDGLFYDDQIAYTYTYPAVSKGAKLVRETSYTIDKPYMPLIYYFGSGLPVERGLFSLVAPVNVDIRGKLFGADTLRVAFRKEIKGRKAYYTWAATDMPAYLAEPYAPSSRYYIPHLIVSVVGYRFGSGYRSINKTVDDYYAWNFDKVKDLHTSIDAGVKAMADSIVVGATDDLGRVRRIFRWVQKNIRYVAIEDGENGYVPRPPALVLHRRFGDCKDKSSLLKALMQSQGLDASLVWVGTRDLPYRYSEFPSVVVDNHMIAAYWDKEGNPHLLDGTTHNNPLEVIPSFILGKECLIERGAGRYVLYQIPVPAPEVNATIDTAYIQFEGYRIVGTGRASYTGQPKVDLIDRIDGADPSKYTNIVVSALPKGSNKLIVDRVTFSDFDRVDDTLRLDYTFSLPDYATIRNGAVYINLNLDRSFQELSIKPGRLQPIEREYPMCKRFVCVLTIPKGFEAQNIPAEAGFTNPKFSFRSQYEQRNGKLVLTTSITMNFLTLTREDFDAYRGMIDALNKSYIQTVVLRQIGSSGI
jgi:transglutaminase-like putative cysteine protease